MGLPSFIIRIYIKFVRIVILVVSQNGLSIVVAFLECTLVVFVEGQESQHFFRGEVNVSLGSKK